MQKKLLLAAACAALTVGLPVEAAVSKVSKAKVRPTVETWYGAARQRAVNTYRQNVDRYHSATLAKVPGGGAFAAPKGIVGTAHNHTGDYHNEMVRDGATRWANPSQPLRVYIGGGSTGYRDNYRSLFAAAMDEWSAASGGKLRWVQVSSPQGADIVATWDAAAASAPGEAGSTTTRHGIGSDGERYIVGAQVAMMPTLNGQPYSDAEMHKIALHEIGHALGLRHSSSNGDIMYWQSNASQISALGPRDAATISRLYSN